MTSGDQKPAPFYFTHFVNSPLPYPMRPWEVALFMLAIAGSLFVGIPLGAWVAGMLIPQPGFARIVPPTIAVTALIWASLLYFKRHKPADLSERLKIVSEYSH